MSVEYCFGKLNSWFSVQKIWNALHGTLGKNIAPKLVQNTFGHLWKRLRAIFENWNSLIFLKLFEDSTLQGTLSIFFSKKLPQNMFKTSLDIFGNDVGHFCNFEFFWFFRKLSMNAWNNEQKNFSKKIAPRHVWTLGNDFGHFRNF